MESAFGVVAVEDDAIDGDGDDFDDDLDESTDERPVLSSISSCPRFNNTTKALTCSLQTSV